MICLGRIRNNSQNDLKKLAEVELFQDRLSERMLDCDDIAASSELLELAMLLEEFRVNRFAPEIKTPVKVSAQRLEEAFNALAG